MRRFLPSLLTRSIKRSMMVTIASVHAVLMTIFVFDLVSQQSKFIQKQISRQVVSLASTLAVSSKLSVLSNDIVGLEEYIDSVKDYPNLSYAMLTTLQGKVLAHTDHAVVGSFTSDAPSLKLLNGKPQPTLVTDDKTMIAYAVPILVDQKAIGWARASLNKHDLLSSRGKVYRDGFLYTLIAILFGTAIAFFISRGLTNSLDELIKIIHLTIRGKRSARAMIIREDEVGVLAKEFNSMLDTLEKNEKALGESQILLKTLNANLETRVKQKTHELQLLNDTLEIRVQEEMEKNKSQIQQMIAQARHAQMGEMISMIAHQWRQPLTSISVMTSDIKVKMILTDFAEERERETFLHQLDHKMNEITLMTQELSGTIDTFRNFYKENKTLTSCSVTHPLQKALEIIEATLKDYNVEIIEKYRSEEVIELYLNEMMQVIINILKNSIDNFIEKKTPNPRIVISTIKTSIGANILICDNGGGIPEKLIEKIFHPYFTTKDAFNGTGLGLYIGKTIVEDHHRGKLYAYNKEGGLCFCIELKKRLSD